MNPYSMLKPLVFSLCCGIAGTGWAEKADKDKPAVVDSDRLMHNELTQTQVFEGNVLLTRGTLVIKADRLESKLDQEGYQMVKAQGSAGKPTVFKQKREGLDETIEAEAMSLDFDGKSDTIVLADKAVLRRYAAGKLQDEVRGASIKFFNQTEYYEVKGGASSSFEGGRVRMVLAPRSKAALVPAASAKP